jgi:hypothetical protein
MVILNRDDALYLIYEGKENFTFPIDLFFFTKFQLYLSGNIKKGIEIFGIGPHEMRVAGFMVEYHDLINSPINKEYRVFISKNGPYFRSDNWSLNFKKNK